MPPRYYVHWFRLRNTVVWPIYTAGEGVNSTIIQCVHEQSLTGMCLFRSFICFQWITYVQIVNLKKILRAWTRETLKRVASANAIWKHYKSSSLITVKRHAMVLSFFKGNLIYFTTISNLFLHAFIWKKPLKAVGAKAWITKQWPPKRRVWFKQIIQW